MPLIYQLTEKDTSLRYRALALVPCYICGQTLGYGRDIISTERLGEIHNDCYAIFIAHRQSNKPFDTQRELHTFRRDVLRKGQIGEVHE